MENFDPKFPDEEYAVEFSFAAVLGSATVASATITATDVTNGTDASATFLDITKQNIISPIVYGWVQNGTANHIYVLNCEIISSDNEKYNIYARIAVETPPSIPIGVTLQHIVDMVRYRQNNFEKPYFWQDKELVSYANEARNTICREARILEDSMTAAICTFPTVANTIDYAYDSRIIYIKSVQFVDPANPTSPRFLNKFMKSDFDTLQGWRTNPADKPQYYIVDYNTGYISFYPKPDGVYTINLSVVRYPLAYFTSNAMETQAIEIAPQYQSALVDGILYQAYLKRGENTYDEKKSTTHFQLFRRSISLMKIQNNLLESAQSTASPVRGFI